MSCLHGKEAAELTNDKKVKTIGRWNVVPVQPVIWVGDEKIEIDVEKSGFQRGRKPHEPEPYFVEDRIRDAFTRQLGDKFTSLTYQEQEEMIERKTYGDEGYELRKIQRTQRSQTRPAVKKMVIFKEEGNLMSPNLILLKIEHVPLKKK